MKFSKKNMIFTVFMLMGIVIFCEVALRALAWAKPRVDSILSRTPATEVSPYITDAKLSKRPNPDYPDHDDLGFRNPFVPDDIDILVLGDSQTYGVGVKSNETWPAKLVSLGNLSTYNMAFSGYGPCQNLLLLEEAKDLKPKLIIATIYSGNDLYDAYSFTYYAGRLTDLKTKDAQVIKAIAEMEKNISLHDEIAKMQKYKSPRSGLKAFLKEHSKLYDFLGAVRSLINKNNSGYKWKAIQRLAKKNQLEIFENSMFRTVFTPRYRLSGLQLDDPRIAEGMRIMFDAVRLMKNQCTTYNLPFVIVLIPTKELVFKDVAFQDREGVSSDYLTLLENEETFCKMAKTFLETEGIFYIDSLSILRDYLRQGKQPYKMSQDGHPNAIGHKAIAELVLTKIRQENLLHEESGIIK